MRLANANSRLAKIPLSSIDEPPPPPSQGTAPTGGWFFRRRRFRSLDYILLLGILFYEKARQSVFNA
jgi:hypothetical protein